MSDHLNAEQLAAFASGELPAGDLDSGRAHMTDCVTCANLVVDEWLLKTAIGKSGHRFAAPEGFRERMESVLSKEKAQQDRESSGSSAIGRPALAGWAGLAGWTAAALVMVALAGWALFYQKHDRDTVRTAEMGEACDLHIAALAATEPPQVVSSDRHTVKPWFQGKLPFSFNIPETLPAGAALDGANLAYLDSHPAAELLFHIDRHRVSIFVQERDGQTAAGEFTAAHAGFHVIGLQSDNLELIAVSDVETGRLEALARDVQGAQAGR